MDKQGPTVQPREVYIQYPMINHNGKESEKGWIYVYAQLNHFAVHLKLTQHCKSTIFQYKIKTKKNKMKINKKFKKSYSDHHHPGIDTPPCQLHFFLKY